MNKEIIKPDFCVIGAGSGGLSFASGASQMGASVVLLESHKMGGDCLNYGCVPSKALIAASKMGHKIKNAKEFGWSCDNIRLDFNKVSEHIKKVIQEIAPNDSVERFEGLGVKVILEKGKFVDTHTVETEHYIIKAKKFIIATGSIPNIPPIEGLSSVPYLTNETIFDLSTLPNKLVVIGGGPIGIEMAQAFRRLGSNVTILETFGILPKDDHDIVNKLKEILILEGIDIIEKVKILSITKSDNEIKNKSGAIAKIFYQTNEGINQEIEASHIFVAAGRRANINDLNLEAANINFSKTGIIVDSNLLTSNPKCYAIGDCTGGYQFTHVAGYHAGLAIRNGIFGLKTKVDVRAIPWVTYTEPELAHVGMQESKLKESKTPYKVITMDFAHSDRAQADLQTQGTIKLLASPKGYVLGVTILGAGAGELIYPWVISIQNHLKLTSMTSSIAPYPTYSDLNKRVAGMFYADKIFSPFVKMLVKIKLSIFK